MQHIANNDSQLQLTTSSNIYTTSVEITLQYNIKLSSTVPTLQLSEEIKIVTDGLLSACVRACMCASACLPVRNRQLMTLSADKTTQ
jgi:hypothetical protein